jgi:hypothetical protein
LDFWRVNCSKHLNKIYYVVKKKKKYFCVNKNTFKNKKKKNVLEYKNAVLLCRFRTYNTKLPIETGRWLNIPRLDRVCILCNNRNIYTRIFADFARKRNRNLDVLANYNKTRINIYEDHQHDRWMELKEALRVQTHAEVSLRMYM